MTKFQLMRVGRARALPFDIGNTVKCVFPSLGPEKELSPTHICEVVLVSRSQPDEMGSF